MYIYIYNKELVNVSTNKQEMRAKYRKSPVKTVMTSVRVIYCDR